MNLQIIRKHNYLLSLYKEQWSTTLYESYGDSEEIELQHNRKPQLQ